MGLISRTIEEAGIPTLYLGSCLDMMERVRPPRSAFVNFPLGRPCGKPYDRDLQLSILKDALAVLTTATRPGEIVQLSYDWGEPFDWKDFMKDLAEMLEEEGAALQEWKPKE